MGMTEKQSLIDSLTVRFAEEFDLGIKKVKSILTDVLNQYHVSISDEAFNGTDLSTEYLMKKFADGKSAIGMREETIKQYRIAVQKLEEYTGKNLADVEHEDINFFMKEYGKKVSDVTVRTKFQLLSSVFNFLHQHKYIGYNPIVYVDIPKATVVYKSPLSDLDLEKIKKAMENMKEKESVRNLAILHFFISTGCRVSELCNVRLSDIDLHNKVCKVKGKGKKERPVVLTDSACYRIKLYLDLRKNKNLNDPLFASIRGKEKAMTKEGIEKALRKVSEISGVKFTCHSFRRFYATELRKRGVNIQMIANSLGHANLNQINRYSLYSGNEMLDIVRNAI